LFEAVFEMAHNRRTPGGAAALGKSEALRADRVEEAEPEPVTSIAGVAKTALMLSNDLIRMPIHQADTMPSTSVRVEHFLVSEVGNFTPP
jgi:hypothetical protein